MLAVLALVVLVPVAALAWRWARRIALAVALVFVSTLAYAGLAWLYPEAHTAGHFEGQRWSSAIVGLVGAVELGAAGRKALKKARSGREALERLSRRGWLGLCVLAAMAGDGVAYLAWLRLNEWVQPVAQIVVSAVMIAVSLWPQRRT